MRHCEKRPEVSIEGEALYKIIMKRGTQTRKTNEARSSKGKDEYLFRSRDSVGSSSPARPSKTQTPYSRTATHGRASASAVEAESVPPSLPEARRRWAELLRRIFEVDPLRRSRRAHEMRIVAFITQPRVIDRILTHLRALLRSPAARPPRG